MQRARASFSEGFPVTEIIQRLLAAVKQGGDFDLAMLSIGQMDEALRTVSDGPATVHLFIWACGHRQAHEARRIALRIIETTTDPGVMAEIVAFLTRGTDLDQEMGRSLWQAFLNRADDRDAHYGVRSQALYGAMFLAQGERSLLRRFQGTLLDISRDDDSRYLRHVARIAGAVLAHEPDDDLRGLLDSLLSVETARDEAAMELGLDALRGGLDEVTHDKALAAFQRAKACFATAYAEGDERIDAYLYSRCLDVLVNFQTGDVSSDIAEQIRGIREAAFEYAGYLASSDRAADTRSWLGSATRERIHWSVLALRLASLDLSFQRSAWLRAAAVIEQELLWVYTASHSIFERDHDGGLEAVLQPRIIGTLQKELVYLEYLDQWIEENKGSERLPDAEAMRSEVAAARERSVLRHPPDAATVPPMVAAALSMGQVPAEHQRDVIARIQANVLARAAEASSPAINAIVSQVVAELEQNQFFASYTKVRQVMEAIVLVTTLFAANRHDVGISTNPSAAYLFRRDENDLPQEQELQRDYYEFLASSVLAGWCRAEVRDLGGGRADILFTSDGVRIVAELKRTMLNCTQERLVDEFGLQAVSYQTTSVTLALLMVLDLFDRGGGQQHLIEQISVHRKTPKWGTTEYSVVLFRIQGRRKMPSDL